MSLSRAELEAMDRDELLATVVELSERVDDIEARYNTLLESRKGLVERIEELEAENERLRERVAELDGEVQSIQSVGSERTSKEEKIAQVVAYAHNEKSQSQTRTTVLPANIKGATGVSRRYAYDLAADMVDDYEWALDPQELARRPDQDTPQKGVVIDFERLHSDPEAVNKFTTGIESEEGSG